MSIQLTQRVSVLEVEVKALRESLADLIAGLAEPDTKPNAQGPRKMCPHCGIKPNYFLHVRSCGGRAKT